MKQANRGGFIKSNWVLGLCVSGVLAAVVILLATPPISQNSVYKTTGAKHRPTGLTGANQLAFNNLAGQPTSQAHSAGGAVLGASVSVSTPPASSNQSSMSTTAEPPLPTNNYPTPMPPASNLGTNPPIPDYFYPVDPPPCRFRQGGSSISGCSYCTNYMEYPCGCGYGGVDIACIAPE